MRAHGNCAHRAYHFRCSSQWVVENYITDARVTVGAGRGGGGGGVVEVLWHGAGASAVVVLLAPGNFVTVWDTLRGAYAPPPMVPVPAGLVALQAAVARGGGSATRALATTPFLVEAASLPRHMAVIMDGNGRWATSQGLGRSVGHDAGVKTINTLIRACRRLRIPFLTLYAFSVQNWSRPGDEVNKLMQLLNDFVGTSLEELCANGVRLLVTGDLAKLPYSAREGLTRMVLSSAANTDLTLCLALSYGGREEIAGAAAAACRAACAGLLDPSAITPETFRAFLPHPHVPDPDLLVRTSGELRVSNFLLWQIAYTELYVTEALWPDFNDRELADALTAFAKRERRFGKTSAQLRGADITTTTSDAVAGCSAMDAAVKYGVGAGMAFEEPSRRRGGNTTTLWTALSCVVLAVLVELLLAPGTARLTTRAAAEWLLRSL